MNQGLRICFLALYATGPVVALLALVRRRGKASTAQYRVKDWRSLIPLLLLPVEWLLPPILIFLEQGEIESEWLPVRFLGLALSVCGAILLIWASVLLGRFLVHAAIVSQDHALIASGPYRFVRHPIYSGYLALLLGSAVGTLNLWLLLLWPISLLGILLQAGAEEKLLELQFGQEYQSYMARTGQLLPRFRGPPGSRKRTPDEEGSP